MSSNSKIEWTDASWNPVVGCSVVSPGCTNCYAMKMAARLEKMLPKEKRGFNVLPNHYAALTQPSKAGPVWTGRVNIAPDHILTAPLRWKKPKRIFVNSMGDLFHKSVPDEWIDKVFAVMAPCSQHTLQLLTKRADRMHRYLSRANVLDGICEQITVLMDDYAPSDAAVEIYRHLRDETGRWPLPNVWLGVSVENQKAADERREHLKALADMGWRTMVSYEPALGPVDWTGWEWLSWLVSGGESGTGARPSHPDWHRTARDFCAANGIPYFFKQWGTFAPYDRSRTDGAALATPNSLDEPMQCFGKKLSGRLLDGKEHNGMPECSGDAA